MESFADSWILAQIIMIDLVMAGDNAIVVGMAAAAVPMDRRRKVVLWGTVAAVVMRIIFAFFAVRLLEIVGLTLAGGLLLAFVCYGMYLEFAEKKAEKKEGMPQPAHSDGSVSKAVWRICLADLSMSLDNVLAVAGAARDHLGLLVVGLLISVVLMAVAANYIADMIHKRRWVGWLGLFMVGYVAVTMIWHGSKEVLAFVE